MICFSAVERCTDIFSILMAVSGVVKIGVKTNLEERLKNKFSESI